jgi:5,10-methenyltetrahydrofolate synthetase
MVITTSLEHGFPMLWKNTVGFYWPYRGEFDPRPAMNIIQDRGARLALPEVENKNKLLRFRRWWKEAPMKTGAYNIPIPDNTELVMVNAILVPMLGFDVQGYRLGYGGGYYDRTLTTISPRPLVIGVAFEILRLENFHHRPHDIAVDFIVTEAGIYRVTTKEIEIISTKKCASENF